MQSSSKPSWGHALVSDNLVRFSHALLAHIPDHMLGERLDGVSYIERESKDSILVHIENNQKRDDIIKTLLMLCSRKYAFFETPKSYYKIPLQLRQSLLSWSLAFEGCLGMLLLFDKSLSPFLLGEFEYINARTGGIYLSPFTLYLEPNFPKIVHPVNLENMSIRLLIEQKAAHYVKSMFRRMEEAQQGMEGIALLSLVEEKTSFSPNQIATIINTKSYEIPAPIYSPFFSSCNPN